MRKTIAEFTAISLLGLSITACSARPVLSENPYLTRVGPETAERDVNECLARADAASERGELSAADVAAGAAASSAVGAAAGGAGGAVVGNAGAGAAAGAVGGAVASLMSSLLHGLFSRREPDPYYRLYVDRCLREKGYEPTVWR